MKQVPTRFTFDQLVNLAKDRENHKIELKNSTYILVNHPLNNKSDATMDRSKLQYKTKKMLAEECSAFANSNGGTLIIGLNDDGSLDSNSVPEYFDNTKSRVEQWIESLIKVSLEPPLEHFDCYTLQNGDANRILVIDIPQSDKAPHQSTVDKLYYSRQGTSAVPAQHWLIEAIRSRRIHPKLEAELDFDRSVINHAPVSENIIRFDLSLVVTNTGSIMADKWAIRIACPFAKEARILPSDRFPQILTPDDNLNNVWMAKSPTPLFPTQAVAMTIRLIVPAHWQLNDSKNNLSQFQWKGLSYVSDKIGRLIDDGPDQEFYLYVDVFADSAPKNTFVIPIINCEFHPKMSEYLQNSGVFQIP